MAKTPIYERIGDTNTYRLVGHGVNGRFVRNTTDRRIYRAVPTAPASPTALVVPAVPPVPQEPRRVVTMTAREFRQALHKTLLEGVPAPRNVVQEVLQIQRARGQR
jgi:hypothetical protein